MDDKTVRTLEAEIEELNKVDSDSEDLDEVDGFMKTVKKQLDKISGKCVQRSSDASAIDTYFKANKTSFVAKEKNHKDEVDDENIYDFTHTDRGLAVIINNEVFNPDSKMGSRPGSSYDATALYWAFRKLGFNVWVNTNLTAVEMMKLLVLVRDSYEHKNADCFVCSILTHGSETISNNAHDEISTNVRQDLLFGIDRLAVSTGAVVDLFSDVNCMGLQGKPRLFFLQACRGKKYDHGTDILVSKRVNAERIFVISQVETESRSFPIDEPDNRAVKRQISFSSSVDPPQYHQHLIDSTDAKPSSSKEEKKRKHDDKSLSSFKKPGALSKEPVAYKSKLQLTPVKDVPICPTPLYKDCLVMYATPPGYFAWRRDTGSWFIQSLCKVLQHEEMRKTSFTKAMTIVNGVVAMDYKSNTPEDLTSHEAKEVPVIESMLVKDIYFTKKRR